MNKGRFKSQALLNEQLNDKELQTTIPLANFIGSSQTDNGIPYALKNYLELTD